MSAQPSLRDRLCHKWLSTVEPDFRDPGACWLWPKNCNKQGYGRLSVMRGDTRLNARTHRIAFMWFFGYVPQMVCHTCANQSCCNPMHLYDGTPKENVRDSIVRNTHTSVGTKTLNAAQVQQIRRLHDRGLGSRVIKRALRLDVAISTIAKVYNEKTYT